jgi:uncharacterized membrane protein
MINVREWVEFVFIGIEILAVVIMMFFIIVGTVNWIIQSMKNTLEAYKRYRVVLGRTLLVGLELLVAADIIRTVALDATPLSLGLLGGLVVVRTFLGWSIVVELEGRWPWQKEKESGPATESDATKGAAT